MKLQREAGVGRGPILIHTEIQFSSIFVRSKFSNFRGSLFSDALCWLHRLADTSNRLAHCSNSAFIVANWPHEVRKCALVVASTGLAPTVPVAQTGDGDATGSPCTCDGRARCIGRSWGGLAE